MYLSDISIRKPVFAWMLMVGLLVFGFICYQSMGISQMPDVDFPVVTISISWAGASPEVMETAVADVVESAIMSVDGIQTVQSTSQQGQCSITLQFSLDRDINVALQDVQAKVSQAQKNLPQSIDTPVITKTNPNDQPIMWAAVYGENSTLRELSLFSRDHLKDKLTTVSGVGDIRLGGYIDPQMRIWLNTDKMSSKDISFQDIIDAVNGEHQLSPTGYQSSSGKESYVQVHSEFTNAKQCENLVIPARRGMPTYKIVRIGDVATCEEGLDEIRRVSRYNSIQPTIGMGVIKQRGTNAVAIGDAVKERIKSLKGHLPNGIDLGIVTDGTVFIKQSIEELVKNLGFSVILTSIVCYLFLGTISSSFNVLLAIPVSLIGSFIVLKFLNFTINSFTLLGLSLSIGIVVDDAIMVLENITRHVEMGKNRVLAALVGAREITGAATSASLAILAIFAPVVFMDGIIGKFFFQFGVAISVAVLISLLEALTLAPMRCSQFLNLRADNWLTKKVADSLSFLTEKYEVALRFCLNWRWSVIAASILIFIISLLTIKNLRKEFIPPQDQSRFMINIYTPMGSSMDFTDNVFKEVEKIMKARPEIEKYYIAVGGFGGGLVNQGISFVTMKNPSERSQDPSLKRPQTQQEFMPVLRGLIEKVPGVQRVALMDLSLTGFSSQRGYPIEFQVQGPDWTKLAQASTDLRTKLKETGLMSDVETDYNPNMPQVEIYPDRAKAAQRGVPVTTISNAIASLVGGMKLLPSKYTDASGHRNDIKIKLVDGQNRNPADIEKIQVRNSMGWLVPLKDLIEIKQGSSLLTISRYNRERGIGIFGNFSQGKSQADVTNKIENLAKESLPEGYHITLSGSSKAFSDSFKSLMFALVLGIFVAYMVLASQFNSFIHPVTILLALPFSITGALLAMSITDTSLNIYSLIGILLLMGIVKKNSILLVEFTNHKRAEGLSVHEALISACPVRLRPILMTSMATIAGALPEALARGEGSEVIRPMAIAVVGGVAVSTFLTLFVVPCGYSLLSRLENKEHAENIDRAFDELSPA